MLDGTRHMVDTDTFMEMSFIIQNNEHRNVLMWVRSDIVCQAAPPVHFVVLIRYKCSGGCSVFI